VAGRSTTGRMTVSGSTSTQFTGTIGGVGVFDKAGSGTLALTGGNAHSGGTIVSGGTLTGNTLSLQGNILNDAALVFDQALAGTYSGTISGAGSVSKTGSGNLTLTGPNTYTGGTTVAAGPLTGNVLSIQGNIINNGDLAFDQVTRDDPWWGRPSARAAGRRPGGSIECSSHPQLRRRSTNTGVRKAIGASALSGPQDARKAGAGALSLSMWAPDEPGARERPCGGMPWDRSESLRPVTFLQGGGGDPGRMIFSSR